MDDRNYNRGLLSQETYTKSCTTSADFPLPPYNIDVKLRLQPEACPSLPILTARGERWANEYRCQQWTGGRGGEGVKECEIIGQTNVFGVLRYDGLQFWPLGVILLSVPRIIGHNCRYLVLQLYWLKRARKKTKPFGRNVPISSVVVFYLFFDCFKDEFGRLIHPDKEFIRIINQYINAAILNKIDNPFLCLFRGLLWMTIVRLSAVLFVFSASCHVSSNTWDDPNRHPP